MRITDGIRKQIIDKTIETYFPEDVATNFRENLKKLWTDYVYALNPDIPENKYLLTTINLYDKDQDLFYSLYDCPYLFINQCVRIKAWSIGLDISTCPVPHFREVFSMYREWEAKRNRFRLLLDTELASIYCDTAFVEQLPYLKSALAPFMPEFDTELAVAIDIDQLGDIAIAG